MAVKFANNVSTTLSSAINATQTTISVADASGLPSLSSGDYIYLTIDTDTASPTLEVVKVTAVSSNSLTVVRGQDGTTASSFSSGTKVELRVTAAALGDISSQAQTAADTESVSIAGDTMTGALTTPGLTVSGNINVGEYITHYADTDTSLRYQDNRATLKSGGGAILDLHSNGNVYLTGSTVQVYGNYSSTGTISSGAITATGSSYFGSTTSNSDQYIRGDSNVGLRIQTNAQGTGGADGLRVGLNAVHAFVWQYEALPLAFATSGTERLSISATGGFDFKGGAFSSVGTISSGAITSSGNVSAVSGHVSGKFAVKSTGVHASYDFYNNGTSYFNGAVTVDHTLYISGPSGEIRFGNQQIIDTNRVLKGITRADFANFTVTGTSTTAPSMLRYANLGSNPEGSHMSHPYFFNDLANFEARGGSIAVGGLNFTPTMTEVFRANGRFASWANSSYTGSTMTITLTSLPHGLSYGGYIGISFGNTSWCPSSCKIELSTDGGSTWTTRLNDTSAKEMYFTTTGTGGTAANAIRFTIGQAANTTSIRVTNIWAYNYNSNGMEDYFLSKGGGTVYGVVTSQGITSSGHITMTSNAHSVNTRSVLARDTNGLNLGSTNGTTAISIDNSSNVSMPYNLTVSGTLTAATQSASDNSTKVATTAYVDSAVSGIVDSAPGTLNTLNELAAALGDDANFSTTVTNSIATKLPLAGGTMTGTIDSHVNDSGVILKSGNSSATGTPDQFKINHNLGNVEISNARGAINFTTGLGAISVTGNSTITGSGSSSNALNVYRGSDSASAFRVLNTGEVLVSSNYFYVDASQGAYIQNALRVRGGISNDTANADLKLDDNVRVTGNLDVDGIIDATRNNGNVAAPSTSDHTAGTRIKFYDTSPTAFYAIGIEGNTMWFNSDVAYKWYQDATLRMHLDGSNLNLATGALQINGTTTIDNARTHFSGTKGYNTTATGNTSTTASTGIKQTYSEGWTAVFADYEPFHEWGLYHDNPNDDFYVTSGNSTNNIGNFTVVNHSGNNRTAYKKIRFDQVDGSVRAGGGYYVGNNQFVDAARRNIYLDSFNGGNGHGIHFRTGFTSTSNKYNASITVQDHNGASADGLHISGYDGVSIGTGGNTYSVDLLVDVNGNTTIYGGADLASQQGIVRVTTGSIAATNTSTRGLVIDGNYTNGQYRHRWRKQDNGGGVPLYLDYSEGTANSFTTIARFGPYTGNPQKFEVYGATRIDGNLEIGVYNTTASGSLYLNGTTANKQARLRCTNGNLHMDPHSGNSMYLNYYSGNGIYFGNGATGYSAYVTSGGEYVTTKSGTGFSHTGGEGREVHSYMPASYTTGDLVAGHEYGWYNDHWRLGMTRSGNTGGDDFVIQFNGSRQWDVSTTGNVQMYGRLHMESVHDKKKIGMYGPEGTGAEWIGTSSSTLELSGANINLNGASGSGSPTLKHGGVTILSTNRVLQGVTADAGIITSGTIAEARLPTQTKYVRSDTSDTMRFDTSTGEHITFQNYTSGGKIQLGFQQNDTDGMHHRLYIKTWKGSATASGNVDFIVRGSGGSTTSDVLSLRSGNNDITWRGYKLWTSGNDGAGTGLDADLVDGYHATDVMGATASRQWSGLNASGTQAKRYHIMRLYVTPAHWDSNHQNIKIFLHEESYESSYVEYHLWSDYNGGNQNTAMQLFVKDAGGYDNNRYKVVVGSPVSAGWNYSGQPAYYYDIYVDVAFYKQVRAYAYMRGHGYTTTAPTSGGATTLVYTSPSGSNISDFSDVKNSSYFKHHKIWNDANDGPGSGLDADTVDGLQGSQFLRSDASDTATGNIIFDGATQYFRKNNATNYTNGSLMVESYGGSNSLAMMGFHISGSIGKALYMNSAGLLTWQGQFKTEDDITVSQGRINVKRGTGLTTTIIEDDSTANGRAQLLLDSHYSDLIVASRNSNPNKHGSTITLATQSTANNDYRKIVLGQGQYNEGPEFLAFAYGGNQTNPHNILGIDNANAGVVFDLSEKRVAIGHSTPAVPLHVRKNGAGMVEVARLENQNQNTHALYISVDDDNNKVRLQSSGSSAGGIEFYTGNDLRMDLASGGGFAVGGAFNALQGKLQVKGDVTINRGNFIRWANDAGGTGEYIYSKAGSPYDVTIHSGSHDALQCPNTGEVKLNWQGSEKLITRSDGIGITGAITFGNNTTAGRFDIDVGSQTTSRGMKFSPYSTIGTRYSGWDTWIGTNASTQVGTQSSGIEQVTSYTASGASILNVGFYGLHYYTWSASELSGNAARTALTLGTPKFSITGEGHLQIGGSTAIDNARNVRGNEVWGTADATIPHRLIKSSNAVSGATLLVENTYGNHSWGITGEFRIADTTANRDTPSILFSNARDTQTWSIGYGYNDTGTFRIKRDHGRHNGGWGVALMSMDRSGNVTFAGNVTAYSDERLKTNIKTISNAVETVNKIRGVTFDWKETGEESMGVVAQEIEAVPELRRLVSETPEDGTSEFRQKNVAYGNMVGLLIEAIKEQSAQIETLTKRIEELENGDH